METKHLLLWLQLKASRYCPSPQEPSLQSQILYQQGAFPPTPMIFKWSFLQIIRLYYLIAFETYTNTLGL